MHDERQIILERLTENEKICLRKRLSPQTAKEIAKDLGISPHAVEKRLKMARTKLGVHSSLEAARMLASSEVQYQRSVPHDSDLPKGSTAELIEPNKLVYSRHVVPKVHVLAAGVAAMSIIAAAVLIFFGTGEPAGTRTASARATPGQVHEFLIGSFAKMDRDKSGFVDETEAPQGPVQQVNDGRDKAHLLSATRERQATWIAMNDADGDGKVSAEEWVSRVQPIFKATQVKTDRISSPSPAPAKTGERHLQFNCTVLRSVSKTNDTHDPQVRANPVACQRN